MNKKYLFVSIIFMILGVACFALYFVFGKTQYIIKFDTDGGSEIPEQKVLKDELVKEPTNPTKDGYVFDKWVYNDNPFDFSTKVKENITLKALWRELVEISITLEGNNYTRSFPVGDKINLVDFNFPPKEEHKVALYLDEDKKEEFDIDTVLTKPLNLIGEYRKLRNFVVKFDSAGGTPVPDKNVLEDEKIEEPKITKVGSTFVGWYNGDKVYDFSKPVTSDMTLVANWRDGDKFNVNFFVDDKKYDTKAVPSGGKVDKPNDPVKEGYIFEGWKYNNALYDFSKSVEKDMDLIASFHESKVYKITFNTDGGSDVATQSVYENNKVQRPADPTKQGFIFGGWLYDEKPYDFNQVVTQHMTLKAKWDVVSNFTVTFDSDGGSSVDSQTVALNGKATRPADPTKEGKTFVAWQLNGTNYDFSNIVTANITLKALWADVKTYIVSFDTDGGDIINNQIVKDGSKAVKPQDPTKNGATFGGWYLNGQPFDFASPIHGDITLVAVWLTN